MALDVVSGGPRKYFEWGHVPYKIQRILAYFSESTSKPYRNSEFE